MGSLKKNYYKFLDNLPTPAVLAKTPIWLLAVYAICLILSLELLYMSGWLPLLSPILLKAGIYWPLADFIYHIVVLLPFVVALCVKFVNYAFYRPRTPKNKPPSYALKIADLTWDMNDNSRGWYIGGQTGIGKTVAIALMIHEYNASMGRKKITKKGTIYPWGGVMLDEKGDFGETAEDIFAYWGRSDDLCYIRVRKDSDSEDWIPKNRFNILSYKYIPSMTYAKIILDTAKQLAKAQGDGGGGGGSSQHFHSLAQWGIGKAIELLRAMEELHIANNVPFAERAYPSLDRIFYMLNDKNYFENYYYNNVIPFLGESALDDSNVNPLVPPKNTLEKLLNPYAYFTRTYWPKMEEAPEEGSGIRSTIQTFLQYFTHPAIVEVLCRDNTVEFTDIDKGKVFCVAIPQNLSTERQFVNLLFSLFYYQHARSRFDLPKDKLALCNQLIIWKDEAQRIITKEDQNVEILRAAKSTTVISTQALISLFPPLGGKENAKPTINSLTNRLIFLSNDKDDARLNAEFFSESIFKKRGFSYSSKSGSSFNTNDAVGYNVPVELLTDKKRMAKFSALIGHTNGEVRRVYMVPRDSKTNRPTSWWRPLCPRHKDFRTVRRWSWLGIERPFYILKIPKPVIESK